ncbi:hypothetical protein PFLUV_G00091840 [Perca fluviatilis]|uniref:Uncharacterized protein n=1 Tax=Perca fluviatilis TaxID=8168 RepID=A0A6A5EGY7_PERFL|nr:hypothetical protein PFLUV_G00091840 [Perca fluviatilis]
MKRNEVGRQRQPEFGGEEEEDPEMSSRLEGLGVLRAPNPENQILQMIAKDIRQQRAPPAARGGASETPSDSQQPAGQEQLPQPAGEASCSELLPPRLQEKGVLVEIQDLPATQFKNVVFDIVPGLEKGTFNVKARFLGIEMEEFPLKYQDLLQLQYEDVAVMKMFDKAKINVNLLIFLLNKKFFKK